jgi:hypothetical protein
VGIRTKLALPNIFPGKVVCRESYMIYHGISIYQFYTALKHIDDGTSPSDIHGNELVDYTSIKQDMCYAFLSRICTELAEGLPTGFKLELSKRVCTLILSNNQLIVNKDDKR